MRFAIMVLAALSALASPPVAAGQLRFQPIGTAGSPAVTDGERWVAFDLVDGRHTRLLDTATGSVRDIERPVLVGCGFGPRGLTSITRSTALWGCQTVGGAPGSAALYDLRTA